MLIITAAAFIFLFCVIFKIRRKYDTIKRNTEQLSQKIKGTTHQNNNLVRERNSFMERIATLEASINTLKSSAKVYQEKVEQLDKDRNLLQKENATINNILKQTREKFNEKELFASNLVQQLNDSKFNSKKLEDQYAELKKELEEKESANKQQSTNLVAAKRKNEELELLNKELIAEIEKLKQDRSDLEKELDENRAFLKRYQDSPSNPFERLAKW